jgi:hypothetical protein
VRDSKLGRGDPDNVCLRRHRCAPQALQVAVVIGDGTVELNKNVVNGSEPILRLIGDLPTGTPVAFEAAWLAHLHRELAGLRVHCGHLDGAGGPGGGRKAVSAIWQR